MKETKKGCDYLFKEIQFCKQYIVNLLIEAQKYHEKIKQLESLAEQLVCEDVSPEMIAENKRLSEEIQKEMQWKI